MITCNSFLFVIR